MHPNKIQCYQRTDWLTHGVKASRVSRTWIHLSLPCYQPQITPEESHLGEDKQEVTVTVQDAVAPVWIFQSVMVWNHVICWCPVWSARMSLQHLPGDFRDFLLSSFMEMLLLFSSRTRISGRTNQTEELKITTRTPWASRTPAHGHRHTPSSRHSCKRRASFEGCICSYFSVIKSLFLGCYVIWFLYYLNIYI